MWEFELKLRQFLRSVGISKSNPDLKNRNFDRGIFSFSVFLDGKMKKREFRFRKSYSQEKYDNFFVFVSRNLKVVIPLSQTLYCVKIFSHFRNGEDALELSLYWDIIYTVVLVRTCSYNITISENVTLYTTTLEAQYFIYSLATYQNRSQS